MRQLVQKLRALWMPVNRPTEAPVARGPSEPPESSPPLLPDPEAAEAIAHALMEERARCGPEQLLLQLPLAADTEHRPTPFAERHEGAPCDAGRRGPRFVVAPIFRTPAIRERVAARQASGRGSLVRYMVDLDARGAIAVNCWDVPYLDERALRENEPLALAIAEALRDAGVDILWVQGISAARVAVVFTEAVGSTIVVLDEAPHELTPSGTWSRMASAPRRPPGGPGDNPGGLGGPPGGPGDNSGGSGGIPRGPRRTPGAPGGTSPLPRRTAFLRRNKQRKLMLLAWQTLATVLCSLLAPPIIEILGVELTIPLGVCLLVSLLLAWFATRTVYRQLKPYIELLQRLLDASPSLLHNLGEQSENQILLRLVAAEILNNRSLSHPSEEAGGAVEAHYASSAQGR